MQNKRGQFYLIASIILLAIIIGIAGVSNYIEKKESIKINYVKDELESESEEVLEYKITNGDDVVEDFLDKYTSYAEEEGREFYFAFGEQGSIEGYKYSEDGREDLDIEVAEEKIKVSVHEELYEFDLNIGYNFYFVIFQELGGEKYVATNE
ncbi:MAG: hypothetical protein ABH804_00865 [archaeon]